MRKKYIKYRLGKENLLGFSLIGWVFVLVSIGTMINVGVEGIVLSLPGLIIISSHTGILVDPERNRIKEYTWICFLKFGRWLSLEKYPDILVLKKKRVFGFGIRGGGIPFYQLKESVYEICFANRTHFSRMLVCRIYDKEQAYQEATELAAKMKCDLVVFNPGRRFPRKVLAAHAT